MMIFPVVCHESISYLLPRFITVRKREDMKVTLIHNPDAGSDEQPSGEELLELMRRHGHTALYQSSKANAWQTALHEAADLVAFAGGDGIVGKVAKQMIDIDTPMAVLPMGTA